MEGIKLAIPKCDNKMTTACNTLSHNSLQTVCHEYQLHHANFQYNCKTFDRYKGRGKIQNKTPEFNPQCKGTIK